MLLLRVCEGLAAVLMGAAVLIVTAVAVCRYGFGFTPVWSEPVEGLLVFLSVCLAIPPGLRDGVHVSIHLLDLLGGQWQARRRALGWGLCTSFGVASTVSAYLYTADMAELGLADYSGMPQALPGVVGILFGVALTGYSAWALVTTGPARRPR